MSHVAFVQTDIVITPARLYRVLADYPAQIDNRPLRLHVEPGEHVGFTLVRNLLNSRLANRASRFAAKGGRS